jgi:hypothetical protein
MLPVWATEKTAAPEVIVTVVDDPPVMRFVEVDWPTE